MEQIIFSVRDVKVDAYMTPFFAATVAAGVRMFSDTVNAPENMLNKHPEDFMLFQIGTFDSATGNVSPLEQHIPLGKALDFLEQPQAALFGPDSYGEPAAHVLEAPFPDPRAKKPAKKPAAKRKLPVRRKKRANSK